MLRDDPQQTPDEKGTATHLAKTVSVPGLSGFTVFSSDEEEATCSFLEMMKLKYKAK